MYQKSLSKFTNAHYQPIARKIGQQITNMGDTNILDLDKEEVINLFKTYGVLLFRGFATNANIFKEFTNLYSTDFINYAGGAFNRRIINEDPTLLSVNDFKSEIKLHGEMYYQKKIPLMIWFFCAHPAQKDGETIICDGQQFFNELDESIKELFERKKIKFRVSMSKEAWIQKYKTDDLDILKEICKNNDTNLKVNSDESILLEYVCPLIFPSRCGKHQVFINSLLAGMQFSPEIISFEDDSKISQDLLERLDEIAESITTEVSWQKGDILMIDNTRIMHGRRSFNDDKRDIYVRLGAPAFPF